MILVILGSPLALRMCSFASAHTHICLVVGGRLYSNARTHTHTHLPCGGGQVVLLGGRLYSNARTHSVAVEDMVEAVKQGLPNALLFRFVFAAHGVFWCF